jgi:hypothetical protein
MTGPDQDTGAGLVERVALSPIEMGAANRSAVRAWFAAHLCGTQRECARALNLSPMAVNRHVAAIRAEWKDKEDVQDDT